MKQSIAKKIGIGICAAALSVALVGCGPAGSSATEAQKANRAYMSQVNETMVELDESLDGFVDAVSRGDIVNMRTQADNAYKVLDKLAGIQAPEELKGVREDYVNGTAKLRDALDRYIALYTEMSSDASSFMTQDDYDARIAAIQALYDEGVALLQKGDATVAGSSAAPAPSASAQATDAASGSASTSASTSTSTSTSTSASASTSTGTDSATDSANTQSGESAGSQMSATPDTSSTSAESASSASA